MSFGHISSVFGCWKATVGYATYFLSIACFWDTTEYPQYVFLWRNKKNINIFLKIPYVEL